MKAQHTPGPWVSKVVGWTNNRPILINVFPEKEVGFSSHKICGISIGTRYPNYREAQATADLIAASPEMLEALQALYDLIDKGDLVRDISKDADFTHFTKQGVRITHAIALMNEAIKKAQP